MIWIAGTSVSIQNGGYVTRLASRARKELDADCRNLSVGDQNSMMGCMRVLAHRHQIQPGDVVIWEYSLLDTILDGMMFSSEEAIAARRVAWNALHELGARILLLLVPPRNGFRACSRQEKVAIDDARKLGLERVDLRHVFSGSGLIPDDEYSDDRHVCLDSPVLDRLVDRLVALVGPMHREKCKDPAFVNVRLTAPDWNWVGADELVTPDEGRVTPWHNSLMSLAALKLPTGAAVELPRNTQIVAVGIISTHASGGVWCGHSACLPVATRLPADLDYSFLLRATPMPCVCDRIARLTAAPTWACSRGVWAGYGQELSEEPASVTIFGILVKPDAESCDMTQRQKVKRPKGWAIRLRNSRDTLPMRIWRKVLRRLDRLRRK